MHRAAATVVDAAHLTKTYPLVTAVDDVSFAVGPGEIVGLLGPNGAGKSTILRLLLDLARPTSGRVRLFGLDPRRHASVVLARTGFLPADPVLAFDLCGAAYLDFVDRLAGRSTQARRDELVDRFDADLQRPLRDLSTGNRQKVALIAALAARPDLIVLDEPTRGLDPIMQHVLDDVLRDERARGAAVILSSHSLAVVERVVDRVCILRDGRMVVDTSLATLKQRARHRVEIEAVSDLTAAPIELVAGVRSVAIDGRHVRAIVEGPVDALLRAVMAQSSVVQVQTSGGVLEDLFLDVQQSAAPVAVDVA